MGGWRGKVHDASPLRSSLSARLPLHIQYKGLLWSLITAMGSRQHVRDIQSGPPLPYADDIRAYKKEYAEALDAQDPLRSFRDEFIIPSKKDLKRKTLAAEESAYPSFLRAGDSILT